MKIATVAGIVAYRMKTESFVHKTAETVLPTPFGKFRTMVFVNDIDDFEHCVLIKGEINPEKEILVRVHQQCIAGDVFGLFRCDCGAQLNRTMEIVQKHGPGVILYMQQEGRGVGLANKLKAYSLKDKGRDTVEEKEGHGIKPDMIDYGIGAQILYAIGVRKMKLITNSPKEITGLKGYGLKVTGRFPIETKARESEISDDKGPETRLSVEPEKNRQCISGVCE